MVASTESGEYADRLVTLQGAWWKRVLPVQAPYRWNLRRLHLGRTLEVGCGIGRNLAHLGAGAVGVDHNPTAVAVARSMGFEAFTPDEFAASPHAAPASFDSLLLAHVLEHMARAEAVDVVRAHLGHVRPGGKVVLITPQERGHRSDATHVEFTDFDALRAIARDTDLTVDRVYSFPFPRAAGRAFVYNEFVVVARTPGAAAR